MRAFAVALAAVMLVALVPAFSPAGATHERPITPGAKIYPGPCTYNTVWEDGDGRLFIGAAAHCVDDVGSRVGVLDIPEIGTVVYRNNHIDLTDGAGQAMDYALVEIDADKDDLVDPSLRSWGGPTGIQETFVPGMPIFQYGHGVVVSYTEATRARGGVLETAFGGEEDPFSYGGHLEDWFLASFPALGGDSGSLVLTADGKALGVTIGVAPTWGHPGWVNGPTFALIERVLGADGWDLTMLTAPLAVADPTGASQRDQVDHTIDTCTNRPVHEYREDHCLNTGQLGGHRSEASTPPPGQPGDVLWEGAILVGSPTTCCIPGLGYLRVGALVDGLDSFQTGAIDPPAGSWIMTETTSPVPVPTDVDVTFWPGGETCMTEAPDEVCQVPEGTRTVQVTGYSGVLMDVKLRAYVLDG